MLSYQYRKSHCGDKTILWPSYFHNGISYTGKMTSLYWIGAQIYSINTIIQTKQCTTKPGVYFLIRGLYQGYILCQCIFRCIFHDRELYQGYILRQCIFRCIFHDRGLYRYILCQCIFRCIFHDQGVVPRIYTLSMYIQVYISWSGFFTNDIYSCQCIFRCIFHDQGVVPRIYTLSMYIQVYISWSGGCTKDIYSVNVYSGIYFMIRGLYQGYILCQCIFRCIFHDQGVLPMI